MFRAKFAVVSITDQGKSYAKIVKLSPRYDTSVEEDRRFQHATPSGEVSLNIDNPAITDTLNVGDLYYIDFTKIDVV